MDSILQNENKNRFNCPIDDCVYGPNGDKYFKREMILNQHIANKHSEKKYCCDRCHKKYAIEWQLKYHLKSCGLKWSCDSCGKSYTERLSLVTHCRRHSHQMPKNAFIRTSKTNSPQINVQLIVMPLIVDSNQTYNQLTQKPIHILPKVCTTDNKVNLQNDSSTQTQTITSTQECNNCKNKTAIDSNANVSMQPNLKKSESVSTQTYRFSQRSSKSRESRSTECQTITKRNRKLDCICESIETQTLESALHSNNSSSHYDCVKISASTSTTPPKKARKRSHASNVRLTKKSCAFTQTVRQLCDSETSTDELELLLNVVNPLLSQMNSTNTVILEQSVQTESDSTSDLSFEFNNIQTQTVNIDIDSNNLLNFSADQELLFSDLEFTDIETQTIWNKDRTTQTDDHLDEIDDVIKKYLDNDNNCETDFTDTETQTQLDLPLLICSYAQT